MLKPEEITSFWREAGPQKWFAGGAEFDRLCESRFLSAHHAAARREHEAWMAGPEGALALILLLDQIPRNVFRGSGHAFATDSLALHYAECSLAAGYDRKFEPMLRAFFYLPYEHSEALEDQLRSVALFAPLGDANFSHYATAHLDVIQRFGRFPHRNRALGRMNTKEEQEWLDAGGGF